MGGRALTLFTQGFQLLTLRVEHRVVHRDVPTQPGGSRMGISKRRENSPPEYGVTWGGGPGFASRGLALAVGTFVVAGLAAPTAAFAATTSSAPQVPVVVREAAGTGNGPEQAVAAFGGSVGRELSILGGFTANVPSDRLDALRAVPGVAEVTEDAGLTLSDADVANTAAQAGSMYTIANKVTGASSLWGSGVTGKGVDIALVDSGIVPVEGLDAPGKVVYGPDLSGENDTPAKNLD